MPVLLVVQVALTNLPLSSDSVLLIALMSRGMRRGGRGAPLLAVMGYLFRFAAIRLAFGIPVCAVAFHLLQAHEIEARPGSGHGMPEAVARITVGNLLMSFENEAALITLAAGNALVAWVGVVLTSPVVFFGSHPVA